MLINIQLPTLLLLLIIQKMSDFVVRARLKRGRDRILNNAGCQAAIQAKEAILLKGDANTLKYIATRILVWNISFLKTAVQ